MSNYPNMSYAMFENTVAALKQIHDRLQDVSGMTELLKDASLDERRAIREFFQMLPELLEDIEELNDKE